LWKTYTISDVAKARPQTRLGSTAWGPSGVGVWTAPVLDVERDTMYVTTGDNYSDPPTAMSDALVALRMSTGEILWSKQLTAKDAWNSSCQLQGKVNCPDSEGPDFDFASSAILVSLPNGKRALLLGQKSAVIYAVDPDRRGQILWQARIGKGGTVGGIEWGSATDGRNVYVALSDIGFEVDRKPGSNDRAYNLDPNQGGGLFAFRVDNGERMWQTPPPGCGDRRPCSPAQSGAVTAIPGVVWSGAADGHLRGYSSSDGKIVWDYDTAHEYQTVNGVAGRGGAMDVAGPVVAGGMLFAFRLSGARWSPWQRTAGFRAGFGRTQVNRAHYRQLRYSAGSLAIRYSYYSLGPFISSSSDSRPPGPRRLPVVRHPRYRSLRSAALAVHLDHRLSVVERNGPVAHLVQHSGL
jgi:polyvinyl alcohol dehydrogenase (cytochrome)